VAFLHFNALFREWIIRRETSWENEAEGDEIRPGSGSDVLRREEKG
jgi:hypothetical protein